MPETRSTEALIAVPTFKRPDQLAELLASLAVAVPESGCRIIVIDNDPARSAAQVALDSPIPVEYVEHPAPGLAEVRNRALDEIDDEAFLVFVDDDETVDPGWFDALVGYARAGSSDIVTAPVVAEFPADAPNWIVRGGFIQRPRFATGTAMTTAASNNTLVRVSSWRRFGAPRFDPAFSTMGGEDTDFFARLVAAGATLDYCDEAIVRERVAPDRLRLAWITRRAYSAGVVIGMIRARDQAPARILLSSAAASGVGALTMAGQLVTLKGLRFHSFERVLGGVGRIASLFGARTTAYERETP